MQIITCAMKRQGLTFKDSDSLNLTCIADNQPEIDGNNGKLWMFILVAMEMENRILVLLTSPLNPYVEMLDKSSNFFSLLVVNLSHNNTISSF